MNFKKHKKLRFPLQKLPFWLLLFGLIFAGCKHETPKPNASNELKNGLLVLNEGLFQLNNSSLSWIDLANDQVDNQIFEECTGRQLGDTGNDMLVFGDKLYIVTSVSSTLEILNRKTLKPIRQISFVENGVSQQPQNLTVCNQKIYVSTFGGKVWVLDASTDAILTKIQVGKNPDRIATVGNHVFVSNSGGLNNPTYDSTVSVIDALSDVEIKRIVVGKNPGEICVTPKGIYVVTRGNYTDIPAKLHRIDAQSLTLDTTFNLPAFKLTNLDENHLLVAYFDASNSLKLRRFDLNTKQLETSDFIDVSSIVTLYNIIYSPTSQRLYIFDAQTYSNTGKVLCCTKTGQLLKTYSVGLNPSKIIYFP